LLIALEEDRKTINRLSADQAKAASLDQSLQTLTRERDDLKHELEAQGRKVKVAETKAKRASVRLSKL